MSCKSIIFYKNKMQLALISIILYGNNLIFLMKYTNDLQFSALYKQFIAFCSTVPSAVQIAVWELIGCPCLLTWLAWYILLCCGNQQESHNKHLFKFGPRSWEHLSWTEITINQSAQFIQTSHHEMAVAFQQLCICSLMRCKMTKQLTKMQSKDIKLDVQ